ncbi:MAG: alpha/beta hydrolase [Caldimonas sp.]
MRSRLRRSLAAVAAAAAALALGAAPARAADAPPAALSECHIAGFRNGVLCGSVKRPLDPGHADRGSLEIHYVVVPALARRKLADPVFFLAGGPGQSAITLAPQVMGLFGRLNNRRDIVFVDQRGTGRSAPLACKDPEDETLAEQAEPERQQRLVAQCKAALLKQAWLKAEVDLGFFTTTIAVQDLDAVRRQLGAERIDLIGGSYGTRVALEVLRQYPQTVRRTVIDGVAPADMALPASFSTDNQAAFDRLAEACSAEPACAKAHPDLGARFAALLQGLPRQAKAQHPLTGIDEQFTLTRELVLGAVRGALYSPALAAALPEAIEAAARGDYAGLVGLSATQGSGKAMRLATGMHLSVVCAEDLPRLASAGDKPGRDFGSAFAATYEKLCAAWPRGAVPAAFYSLPSAPSATLVLSGGIDPVTPPRHGERVAKALGPLARHVVVANAGHGVMAIGCMRDVIFRFVDAVTDAAALAVDAGCAAKVPRPPAFVSLRAAHAKASEPGR